MENLYIHQVKLDKYLLDINDVDGGSKAKLLLSYGFSPENADLLRSAIIQQVADADTINTKSVVFGQKYIVDGMMLCPNGKSLNLRSIWIRESNEEIIKFVTLYPL